MVVVVVILMPEAGETMSVFVLCFVPGDESIKVKQFVVVNSTFYSCKFNR